VRKNDKVQNSFIKSFYKRERKWDKINSQGYLLGRERNASARSVPVVVL